MDRDQFCPHFPNMSKACVALLMNLLHRWKINESPDPTGTGQTPSSVWLHALTREHHLLQHLEEVQSTFQSAMGAGTMCGCRGKWRQGLVLAQHMRGTVTQMAHRMVLDHSRETSLPRNSFSSRNIDVFKLMLLEGMYQCQHILNWETCLGT